MAVQFPQDPLRNRRENDEFAEGNPDLPLMDGDEPDDAEFHIVENDDGSAIIESNIKETKKYAGDFTENLAEDVIEEYELKEFATGILDFIDRDLDARKERDQQYADAIKRSGLGEPAPGGAEFAGANKVTHPLIAESCVDFSARMMRELFPPNGPVRSKIIGTPNFHKIARANRKTQHMNWQLTYQIPNYRAELEQMLTQEPMAGSQYTRWWWNSDEARPDYEFVPADDVIIPAAASNFYTAERITHRQYITQQTYEDQVATGYYRDVDIFAATQTPEISKSEKANNKIEGIDLDPYNQDGVRTVYNIYITHRFETDPLARKDGRPAPYIVVVDVISSEVLAVYRNWKEDDKRYKKLDWITSYDFIPWRGAQGIGIWHLIGQLSAAATGALRALLDSAHINNAPTLLKLKGAKVGGQSTSIQATQVAEIQGTDSTTDPDIRKYAMPVPFNPPSPVLFQLLGFLVDSAKGVVSTAEEKISDANSQMPVGTTNALLEQGAIVFSSIFARNHAAQARSFEILHRLNADYLDEMELMDDAGEILAYKSDYDGPMDVQPVSDPNIFSETQRYAQNQAILALNQSFPQLFDQRAIVRRNLETMKVPNIDEILLLPETPKPQNPVAENVSMALGRPATAFPDQDHFAHIQVHLNFLTDPLMGHSALLMPTFMPAAIEHLKQHIVFSYAKTAMELTNHVAGQDVTTLVTDDQDVMNELDKTLALISQKMHQNIPAVYGKVMTLMDTFVKASQAMQQPPGANDPSLQIANMQLQAEQAKNQTKQMEIQQTGQIRAAEMQQRAQQHQQELSIQSQSDQQKMAQTAQMDQQKTAMDLQANQQKMAMELDAEQKSMMLRLQEEAELEMLRAQNEMKIQELQSQTELRKNEEDNATAIEIAEMRSAEGKIGNIKNGSTIGE